jgi:hypothetical protein
MDELNACNWNNKGLNALFMVVAPEELKRISIYEIVGCMSHSRGHS